MIEDNAPNIPKFPRDRVKFSRTKLPDAPLSILSLDLYVTFSDPRSYRIHLSKDRVCPCKRKPLYLISKQIEIAN